MRDFEALGAVFFSGRTTNPTAFSPVAALFVARLAFSSILAFLFVALVTTANGRLIFLTSSSSGPAFLFFALPTTEAKPDGIIISNEALIGGFVAVVLEPTAGTELDAVTTSKEEATTKALTDGIVAVVDNSVSGCR